MAGHAVLVHSLARSNGTDGFASMDDSGVSPETFSPTFEHWSIWFILRIGQVDARNGRCAPAAGEKPAEIGSSGYVWPDQGW